MRVFKIPFANKREEKIFGGYLSLRQFVYLLLIASSFSILPIHIFVPIKILFISLVSIFLLCCAFFKIKEQNFDQFFFYVLKFLIRKKIYIYER